MSLASMATLNITGTGGIIEGNLQNSNVNVNLDPALTLDGSADYLTATTADFRTSDSNGVLTAWFKTSSSSTQMIFSAADTASSNYFQFFYIEEYLYCAHKDSGSTVYDVRTNTQWNDGSWHHVAFESNGSLIKIYVDGVNQTLVTNSGSNNGDWFGDMTDSNLDNITIGASTRTGTEYYFNGSLADVRYYNANMDNFFDVVSSKIGATTVNDAAYMQHQWKLNSSTISTSGVGDDTGAATAIDLTPTSIVAGSFDYDAFSVNVQDNSTTTDGAVTVTQGKLEGLSLSAPDLNGSADYFQLSDIADASFGDGSNDSAFTFSAWIRADEATSFRILSKGVYNTNAEYLFQTDGSDRLSLNLYDEDVADTYEGAYTTETIAQDKWVHVVGTYNGVGGTSANAGITLYIDGVAGTMNLIGNGTYVSMVNGSAATYIGRYDSSYANGEIRDVRIYDYELSADQVSSLYSGSYNITPLLGWKMNDNITNTRGYGTSSTGHTLSGEGGIDWVNGTLDLDGTLTIAANGTLSAPRGNLDIFDGPSSGANGKFNNSGTFTHNNGTVITHCHDGSSEGRFQDTGSVEPVFYNLTIDDNTDGHGDLQVYGNITIANSLTTTGAGRMRTRGTTTTIGTTTSAGNITMGGTGDIVIAAGTHQTFQGASSLYPAEIKTNQPFTFGDGSWKFKDVDFQVAVTTGGGGATLTLTGDCEFDSVTISAGDRIDVNGQRMECSSQMNANNGGIFDLTGGSMLVCQRVNIQGTGNDDVLTDANTVIWNTGGAGVSTSTTAVDNSGVIQGTFIFGASGHKLDGFDFVGSKLIIMEGLNTSDA